MSAQPGRVAKHLRTQRAVMQLNVRRVGVSVRAQMDPERLFLREPFRAMRTVVGLLSRVRHQVSEEDLLLGETLLAHFALERPLSRVYPLMSGHR